MSNLVSSKIICVRNLSFPRKMQIIAHVDSLWICLWIGQLSQHPVVSSVIILFIFVWHVVLYVCDFTWLLQHIVFRYSVFASESSSLYSMLLKLVLCAVCSWNWIEASSETSHAPVHTTEEYNEAFFFLWPWKSDAKSSNCPLPFICFSSTFCLMDNRFDWWYSRATLYKLVLRISGNI